MSRYDGLIIPRSYSEYINKTDAATLLQALQQSGVMDAAPTAGSNHPAKSGGIKSAIDSLAINSITNGETRPPTSSAVYNSRIIDKQISIPADGTPVDTGISANGGTTQKFGYLFLIMGNTSDGDLTYCRLYLVRTGYSGNHVTPVLIAENGSSGSYNQTIGVNSQGRVIVSSNINCKLCIF